MTARLLRVLPCLLLVCALGARAQGAGEAGTVVSGGDVVATPVAPTDAGTGASDAGHSAATTDAGVTPTPPTPTPPTPTPPPTPPPPKPAPPPAPAAAPTAAPAPTPTDADTTDADAAHAAHATDDHEDGADDEPPSFSVVVDEISAPISFRVRAFNKDPRRRANEASTALSAALKSDAVEDADVAQVFIKDGVAIVKVRGRSVTTLSIADANDAGAASLEAYGEELETRMVEFVDTYTERHSVQQLAFHIFFSIFLVVLAVLTLRGLNAAFARADAAIEDRTATIKPLVILDVSVLSSDALRGVIGTALVVGRVTAVVGVAVAAAAGVLAQFDRTRPFLESVAAAAGRPVLRGLEAFVTAIPGLVLAAILFVLLRGGLRFLKLLLDGVAAGRVKSSLIPAPRASVARVVLTGGVILLALPLIIGAAFGGFGTPFESLTLGAGGVILLGLVPMAASAVIGVTILWRSTIKAGDWVEIDGTSGEVSAINLTEIVLVPSGGGTLSVPMLLLAIHPLRRMSKEPQLEHLVRVERNDKAAVLIDKLKGIAKSVDGDGGAEILEADHETVLVRLHIPVGKSDAHNVLSRAVLNAVDDGVIVLASGKR